MVRRSAARSRTRSGVISESPEAIRTTSSYVTSARNASTASRTSLMSAAFLVCVNRGQSMTSNPAPVKNRPEPREVDPLPGTVRDKASRVHVTAKYQPPAGPGNRRGRGQPLKPRAGLLGKANRRAGIELSQPGKYVIEVEIQRGAHLARLSPLAHAPSIDHGSPSVST